MQQNLKDLRTTEISHSIKNCKASQKSRDKLTSLLTNSEFVQHHSNTQSVTSVPYNNNTSVKIHKHS